MARKDEYKATEYPGIKQRIKDGKYLVVIEGKIHHINQRAML